MVLCCCQDVFWLISITAETLMHHGKIDTLSKQFVTTGDATCPINFDIGWAGIRVIGIGVGYSATWGYSEFKMAKCLRICVPLQTDSAAAPIWMNAKCDIDLLAYFECCCCLNYLSSIRIDRTCHLWIGNVFLCG